MTKGKNLRVAVIGAGAAGILAAIKLQEYGVEEVRVFEKESDLGGTWRDNTYPGLICDVPSHLYRFSFAPNPAWSRTFSPGSEIYAYMREVAESNNVEQMVSYNSEVTKLHYEGTQWNLWTTRGDEGKFDVVISAVGILHHPVYPDIEGVENFEGDCFHSSRWNHDVSLKGKRIGIIGTGSTAVQIVGAVIDDVAELSLFQRTPQWVLAAPNDFYSEESKALYRSDPKQMEQAYQGLATTLNHGFAAAVVGENEEALLMLQNGCQQNLDENIHDPELRSKLTPDYSAGCKRLIVSDLFYPAISKPNAELVIEGISRIEAKGIRTSDGHLHELDVLVFATGFDAHRFLADAEVVGLNGKTLEQSWSRGNYAYKTICVPDFPNLFFLGGPHSPIGNFSYLLTAETQYAYVEKLIGLIRDGTVNEINPRMDTTQFFNERLNDAMPKTVWASGCQSWYFDHFGRVASWPWTFDRFEEELSEPVLADFQVD